MSVRDIKLRNREVHKTTDKDGVKYINQYKVLGDIARGNFGAVKLCSVVNGDGGEVKVVVKRYRKRVLARHKVFGSRGASGGIKIYTQLDEVNREIEVFQQLHHPRCLMCREVLESEGADGKLYLVMDWMEFGPLMKAEDGQYVGPAPSAPTLPEEVAKSFIRDIAEGLEYLHRLGVAHRDLKPDNALLGSDGHVRIGDFGSAEHMDSEGLVRGTKGTYIFMPPECFEILGDGEDYKGHDGAAADVWALGVCLWAFLFGTLPFEAASIQRLFETIAKAKYTIPDGISTSEEAKGFLTSLLAKDVTKRLTAREVVLHPWLKTCDDRMLNDYMAKLRGWQSSAMAVRQHSQS